MTLCGPTLYTPRHGHTRPYGFRNCLRPATLIHTTKCSFLTPSSGLITSGKVSYRYCTRDGYTYSTSSKEIRIRTGHCCIEAGSELQTRTNCEALCYLRRGLHRVPVSVLNAFAVRMQATLSELVISGRVLWKSLCEAGLAIRARTSRGNKSFRLLELVLQVLSYALIQYGL